MSVISKNFLITEEMTNCLDAWTQALSARGPLLLQRMCMQQQSALLAEAYCLKNDSPYPPAGYTCSMLCLSVPHEYACFSTILFYNASLIMQCNARWVK